MDKEQFEQDLKVWELTGKAPNTPAMKKYGVTPGTVWSTTILNEVEVYKQEQEIKEVKEEKKFSEQATSYQDYFGNSKAGKQASIPGMNASTAEAVAMLATNTDRNSALNKLNANSKALEGEGVDITQLTKAINILYPDIKKASLPSNADWNNPLFVDPSTSKYRTDMMNQYSKEIQDWLTNVSGLVREDNGEIAMIIPALADFYAKFPGGSGNLTDKLTFIRSKNGLYTKTQFGK